MPDNNLTQLNNSPRKVADFHFEGFRSPTTTAIPDEFFDVLAPRLSEAELRVLLYIMRRTFGFKKRADAISLGQLTDGIHCKDGRVLDEGTGMSKPSVIRGVSGLVEKGIIWIQKHTDSEGRSAINLYGLCFADTQNQSEDYKSNSGYSVDEYSNQNHDSSSGRIPKNYNEASSTPVTQSYSQGATSDAAVTQSYTGSKAKLPSTTATAQKGKTKLPPPVTQHDDGSNVGLSLVVTQHDAQHNRLTPNSNQKTVNNTLMLPDANLTAGNLAVAQSKPDDFLARELTAFGLEDVTISRLCQKHSTEYLAEKIKLVRSRLNNGSVKNPVGLLLWAIENDYKGAPTVGKLAAPPNFANVLAYVSEGQQSAELTEDIPAIAKLPTGLQTLKKKPNSRRSSVAAPAKLTPPVPPRPVNTVAAVKPAPAVEDPILLERLRYDLTARFNEAQTALYLAGAILHITGGEVVITLAHPLYSRRITPSGRAAIEYSLTQLLKHHYSVRFT